MGSEGEQEAMEQPVEQLMEQPVEQLMEQLAEQATMQEEEDLHHPRIHRHLITEHEAEECQEEGGA
jgi:hypothetical protein